jgi:hypothetical protein
MPPAVMSSVVAMNLGSKSSRVGPSLFSERSRAHHSLQDYMEEFGENVDVTVIGEVAYSLENPSVIDTSHRWLPWSGKAREHARQFFLRPSR